MSPNACIWRPVGVADISLVGSAPAKDALPVAETGNAASLRNHLHRVAERPKRRCGEERGGCMKGCPQQWAALPPPPPAADGRH